LERSLHRTLLAAAFVVGAAWSLPVQPGTSGDGPTTVAIVASPVLTISAQPGIVRLSGHTSSRHHEARLQQVVAQHFPDRDHVFEFRPYGPAPDWWVEATTGLVGAIAALRSPRARLDDTGLAVRALADRPELAKYSIAALTEALPVPLDTDMDILDAGPVVTVRSLCIRQFEAYRNGPINFLESQTRMRASAQPELERVVALAGACRDAMISITGHTDASGDEAWNQSLSLARARAVGDWLVARGVEAERIVFNGAGSSEPVASNETRYGRSLNRRIDIAFAYED
jgi:outer membrane protein OmpA-like peptidoglycan-associated protein